MPMPKAAMNKDHLLKSGEDKVRLAGQITTVETKTKSHLVYQGSHSLFGLAVLAFDRSHDLATFT